MLRTYAVLMNGKRFDDPALMQMEFQKALLGVRQCIIQEELRTTVFIEHFPSEFVNTKCVHLAVQLRLDVFMFRRTLALINCVK